jgi:hypothetical protein
MKTRVLASCLALLSVSCAKATSEEPDTPHGVLTLALTGVDSGGVTYWLRNANFDVTGYPDGQWSPPIGGMGGFAGGGGEFTGYHETFSSDDFADDPTVTLRLIPGYYNVQLLNGDWYLERATAGGPRERVEQAVLLSPYYQSAYVWDGGVATLAYRFGVDGELIDFRNGELQIGVEIEKPGERCTGGFAGWGGFPGMTPSCGSAGAPAPIP